MELTDTSVAAKTMYSGRGTCTVSAGNDLKIEADNDVLRAEVPAGKVWAVSIKLTVVETDV